MVSEHAVEGMLGEQVVSDWEGVARMSSDDHNRDSYLHDRTLRWKRYGAEE